MPRSEADSGAPSCRAGGGVQLWHSADADIAMQRGRRVMQCSLRACGRRPPLWETVELVELLLRR